MTQEKLPTGIWTLIHTKGESNIEEIFIGALSPEMIGWFYEAMHAVGATIGSRQAHKRTQWYAIFNASEGPRIFRELADRGFMVVTHEYVKP